MSNFGSKADKICTTTIEEYTKSAPLESEGSSSAFTCKLEELKSSLGAPLQVLYLRQLTLLRESALALYKSTSKASNASDCKAMLVANTAFLQGAKSASRKSFDWTYDAKCPALQSVMLDFTSMSKKLAETQVQSSQQQSTAMKFLQQMVQKLQLHLYGQSSLWNMAMAYGILDTKFNLHGSYQQGRANFQLSCVLDEYATMLGLNGFTNGVGPGNLGLSSNLSI